MGEFQAALLVDKARLKNVYFSQLVDHSIENKILRLVHIVVFALKYKIIEYGGLNETYLVC